MRKSLLTLLLSAIFSIAVQTSMIAGSKTPMTSKSLRMLITGTVVHGTNTSGKKFIQVFGANGLLESGYVNHKGSDGKWAPNTSGTWKVSKGRLCNTYTKPKKRNGGCDRFYQTSDGRYVYKTGSGKWGSFDSIKKGRTP
jgi:hypothetical protein